MVDGNSLDVRRVDIGHLGAGMRISEWSLAQIDLTGPAVDSAAEGGIPMESIGAVAGIESVLSGQILV